MVAIVAGHYYAERERLKKNPILIAMADELRGKVDKTTLVYKDGGPTWDFMTQSNDEFRKRQGTGAHTIGAVAHALLELL